MQDFKRLRVYEQAHNFVLEVYAKTANFPIAEQYGLTQQIRRAAISVVSNLCEGTGRQTQTEFRRFLFLALGSCKELEAQLKIALDLGYLQQNAYNELLTTLTSIQKQLISLIKSLTPNSSSQTANRSPHTQLS